MYVLLFLMTSLLANDINDTSCLCSFLCGTKAPVFDMVGDFNFPYIDWSVPINTGSLCSSLFLTCIWGLPRL